MTIVIRFKVQKSGCLAQTDRKIHELAKFQSGKYILVQINLDSRILLINVLRDALKKLRLIDDRIVHALNKNLPTQSFQGNVDVASNCRHIYDDIQTSYNHREKSIQHCIRLVSDDVKKLSEKRQQDPDNMDVIKGLRREQTKLRLMQQEMNVEEVVKDRTLKVFYERCRDVYTPPSAPIVI